MQAQTSHHPSTVRLIGMFVQQPTLASHTSRPHVAPGDTVLMLHPAANTASCIHMSQRVALGFVSTSAYGHLLHLMLHLDMDSKLVSSRQRFELC